MKLKIVNRVLLLAILYSCAQRSDNDHIERSPQVKKVEKATKSRLDMIKEKSYRTLSLPENLKPQFLSYGNSIWRLIQPVSLDSLYLFKIKNNNKYEQVEIISKSIFEIRKNSYELWGKKDFISTALVYPSITQDVNTGYEENNWVIEFEHDELTGTLYLFIPDKNGWDLDSIRTTYVERN